MLTLYHNDMSVCAAKVRTALAAKKLDWNGVHLDLRRGDAQEPEYLKLNSNAVVPTLVHDCRVIARSRGRLVCPKRKRRCSIPLTASK